MPDFIRASPKSGMGTGMSAVTATGHVVGTPAYMAPEQLTGDEILPAVDIYALGLVIYEMVTGRLPFASESPMGGAFRRLRQAPPPPRSFAPDLHPVWEETILRCLEAEATDRFASVDEVAKALAGASAANASVARRASRAWLAAAVIIVAVVGAAIAFGARFVRAPASGSAVQRAAAPIEARRSIAVLGFKNLSERSNVAWLSNAFSEMLTMELAVSEKVRTIPGEEVVRTKNELRIADAEALAKDTLARVRTDLGTDLLIVGSYVALAEGGGGQIRLDVRVQDARNGETTATVTETGTEAELLNLVSRTGVSLREKLGIAELSASQADAVRASHPAGAAAGRSYMEGLAKLRASESLAARDLLAQAVASNPDYPLAHSALASAWSALGYDAKAADAAKRAFELSGKLSREERLSIEGQYREMARDLDRAVEIHRTLFNLFPDSLEYGLRFAAAQTGAGKSQDALKTLEQLRRLPAPMRDDARIDLAEATAARRLSDYKRQQTAAARAAQKATAQGATILLARARLAESEAFLGLGDLEQTIAVGEDAQRIFGTAGDRAGAARALNRIATARRQQGALPEAKRLFELTLATYREIGDRSGLATVTNNLANVVRQQGHMDDALTMYNDALVIFREIGQKDGEALALNNSAIVLRQQGDLERAKSAYERALSIRRQIGEKSGIAQTLGNLGNVFLDLGRLAEAEKMYDEGLSFARETGEKRLIAAMLDNLASVVSRRGGLVRSRSLNQESLTISRDVGDKRGVARSQMNLAEVLVSLGELAEATTRYQEAFEVATEVGDKRILAYAQAGLGNVLLAQAKFSEARHRYEEALATRQAAKERSTIPETHLALALLSIEEGHAAEGERLAQQAIEEFRGVKAVDGEALAGATLADAYLTQNELAKAQQTIDKSVELSRTAENRLVRASVGMVSAKVRASSREATSVAGAVESLEQILTETRRRGMVPLQFESLLALGELEIVAGNVVVGRARLATLEKNATAKGFTLIAQKAAAARR